MIVIPKNSKISIFLPTCPRLILLVLSVERVENSSRIFAAVTTLHGYPANTSSKQNIYLPCWETLHHALSQQNSFAHSSVTLIYGSSPTYLKIRDILVWVTSSDGRNQMFCSIAYRRDARLYPYLKQKYVYSYTLYIIDYILYIIQGGKHWTLNLTWFTYN